MNDLFSMTNDSVMNMGDFDLPWSLPNETTSNEISSNDAEIFGETVTDINLPWGDDNFIEKPKEEEVAPAVMPWDVDATLSVTEMTDKNDIFAEATSEEVSEPVKEEIEGEFAEITENPSENNLSDKTVEDIFDETAKDVSDEVMENISNETAEETSDEVTENTSDEIVKEVTDETAEEVSETTSEEIAPTSEEISEEVKEELKKEELSTPTVVSLVELPASDGNFTSALDRATEEELLEAITFMKQGGKHATRLARVEAKLKKVQKNGAKIPVETEKELNEERIEKLVNDALDSISYRVAVAAAELEELEEAVKKIDESDTERLASINDHIGYKKDRLAEEEQKKAEVTENSDSEEKAEESKTSDSKKDNIPSEPIFEEDEYQKLEGLELDEKEKSILYVLNHYHVAPDLLNALLEGNFKDSWKNITEINKINMSVRKKLEKELKNANDDRIKVVRYLEKKASEEPEFAKQILLEHKSFERCYKTYTDELRKMFLSSHQDGLCIQVDDDKIYQMAVDYYWLDDFEQIMKERKEAEERKKKAEEARKKAAERKKTSKKKAKTDDKTETKTDDNKTDTKTDTTEVKAEDTTEVKADTDTTKTDNNTEIKETVVSEKESEADVEEKTDKLVDIKDYISNGPKIDTSTSSSTAENEITEPIEIAPVSDEEQKNIDEAVKKIEEEKKQEEEERFIISDSFGQLTFSF